MKKALKIHHSVQQISNTSFPIYFTQPYLRAQKHIQLIIYETPSFVLPVVIEEEKAISIPRSPFGSFFEKKYESVEERIHEWEGIREALKTEGIRTLLVHHPSSIYHFFDDSWFQKAGFGLAYEDTNQHIQLASKWQLEIHKMQRRKLEQLRQENFYFQKLPTANIAVIHQFIAACRQSQGLEINISLALLQELADNTGTYDLFGVFREDKISAACICVRVTDQIAYYYLPATSPTFKSQSPMVLLIAGMVEYYHERGFEYFDLGISSVQGKEQETLKMFKQRMGATETPKRTWQYSLND